MKKFLALLLAVVMVLGLATVVSAEGEQDTSKWVSAESSTAIALKKVYTVNGTDNTALFPAETLKFAVAAADTNPDATAITVDDLVVTGNTNQVITVNLPSYSKVGVYKYTISEVAGNTKGVTYETDTLDITVLVEYDYENNCLKATPSLTTGQKDNKVDTFTNEYDVGSLKVTKVVTGNLGDKEKKFSMTVTFTTDKPVLSTITCSDGQTIAPADWADGKATVEIALADSEFVTFTDIPAGVDYTVVESDEYSKDTNKNGVNGYDAPVYENASGKIAKASTANAKVTNNKETSVETGIALDTVPFVVMIVVAALGLVAFTAKKRVQE